MKLTKQFFFSWNSAYEVFCTVDWFDYCENALTVYDGLCVFELLTNVSDTTCLDVGQGYTEHCKSDNGMTA